MNCDKTDCIHYKVCEEWKSLGNDNYINESDGSCDCYLASYNPSGDCISRSALREAIFYHDYSPCKIDENANEIMRQARIIIDNAPTVEAYTSEDIVKYVSATEDLVREKLERPKGEWVYRTDIAFFTCSKCDGIGYIRDKFCKHCGAEMQGGAE